MDTAELAAWCMALGAIGTLALARATDWAVRPTRSRLRGCAYHGAVFVLVLALSGLAARVWAWHPAVPQALQVLAGPACVGLSNLWIRRWLGAAPRDRLVERGLLLSGITLPLLATAALALPPALRLPVATALTLLGGGLTVWLTSRAALLGDRLAPWMALGCALALLALAGLHAFALQVAPRNLALVAAVAACAALSNVATGLLLWRRDCDTWDAWRPEPANRRDPVTRLPCGVPFGRQLLAAERRRRSNGRRGALLAVVVYDVERITAQAGVAGTHEYFAVQAARMQRQVGVVNAVGRYGERCFVSLLESVEAAGTPHALALRLADHLGRPLEVRGFGRERVRVRPDIGVGVVALAGRGMELEDMLHEVQRAAEAARRMQWRAAAHDPDARGGGPLELRPARAPPHTVAAATARGLAQRPADGAAD